MNAANAIAIFGTESWTRQFGNDGDDAFMRAYDSNGNALTTVQFGTDKSDSIKGITKNWSELYVAGSVSGTLPGQTSLGNSDAFVANLKLPNCWESLESWENYCANSW